MSLSSVTTKATWQQVPYKWRQICGNILVIICTLDKKGQQKHWYTEKCSVTRFLNFSQSKVRLTLTFTMGKDSRMVSTLSISLKGSAMEWMTWMNGTISGKTIFSWCAFLWWVNWWFVLLQISPSSHLNSHSSQLNVRLMPWVSLASELLRVQQYSHFEHFYGCLPLWEGFDSNQYLRSSNLYGRSPLWECFDSIIWPSESWSR